MISSQCMGAPENGECQLNLERMLSACQCLGIPVAKAKYAGPASVMVFLGFELDSAQIIVRLPAEKLELTNQLMRECTSRKDCKKKDFESLLGHHQHAATVVRPGRTFMRRLIKLLLSVKSHNHWVCLNASTHSDLMWWRLLLEGWNGVSILPNPDANGGAGDSRVWLMGLWSLLEAVLGCSGSGRLPLMNGISPQKSCSQSYWWW